MSTPDLPPDACLPSGSPVWLTVKDAAARARCSEKIIRRAAGLGKLRRATINERGDLRFKAAWIDSWLEDTARPVEVRR